MTTRCAVVFVVLSMTLATPSLAGVVAGRLTLSKSAAQATAVKTVKQRAERGVTDAVVYIQQVPEKVERKLTRRGWFAPKKPKPQRIVQKNQRFVPRVLVTTAGSDVEFMNLDRVYHNTFSVSAAKRFDLGKYAPGHRDTVSFRRAGVANLHCDIHPDEVGFVVVLPNHAFARPDSLGRFKLPKLPPGAYAVRVWHPRLGEISQSIEMPKRGNLALDLSY